MSTTRIYKLEDLEEKEPVRLIEATNQAAAIRFAASRYKASVASAKEVAKMMEDGIKVENRDA